MSAAPARVVAISGPPGSGKSTLARALAARLDAPLVSYDAYEAATGRPAGEVEAWVAAGADVAALSVPGLAEDLAALKMGEAVRDRAGGGRLRAERGVVVLDTLLGRAHARSGALIDRLAWIDLPLDLALARKLRRVVAEERARRGRRDFEGLAGWLEGYLGHYERFVRDAYLAQAERVAPGADLTLDGTRPVDILAARTIETLVGTFSENA
jgi:uridine kinase